MRPPQARYFILASAVGEALAFLGTVGFRPALLAHPSPAVCPPPGSGGVTWAPDADYLCCQNNDGSGNAATLTTARGPGATPIYACCREEFTCTGTAPFVSDWTTAEFGKLLLHLLFLLLHDILS